MFAFFSFLVNYLFQNYFKASVAGCWMRMRMRINHPRYQCPYHQSHACIRMWCIVHNGFQNSVLLPNMPAMLLYLYSAQFFSTDTELLISTDGSTFDGHHAIPFVIGQHIWWTGTIEKEKKYRISSPCYHLPHHYLWVQMLAILKISHNVLGIWASYVVPRQFCVVTSYTWFLAQKSDLLAFWCQWNHHLKTYKGNGLTRYIHYYYTQKHSFSCMIFVYTEKIILQKQGVAIRNDLKWN